MDYVLMGKKLELDHKLLGLSAEEGLQFIANNYSTETCFSTSFGIEDQVVTHMIAQQNLPISFFTLDTGRLFAETYEVWDITKAKYGLEIETYYPMAENLQNFVTKNGPNSFYESVQNRKDCCYLRKVEPLQRAIKNKKIWITGIRAEQSQDRNITPIEYDSTNNIIKYHPILYWTFNEVNTYVQQNNVPTNKLHNKGFVSIGCAPCTRAIEPGEDFRAGRWWWETSKKECGLHVHQ